MTSDVATWERLLERLERDIDAACDAFERGDDVRMGGFAPPSDLPALPPACAERARTVLERQRELETAVATKAAEIGGQLSRSAGAAHHQPRHHQPRQQQPLQHGVARHGARFETRV